MFRKRFSGSERLVLGRLRLEWAAWALAGGLFAALGYAVLRAAATNSAWDEAYALRWLAAAVLLLLYQFGSLWQHLDENRLKDVEHAPLIRSLGLANAITISRSVLVAGLVGFLFAPRPAGWMAWAPSTLFLAASLMDFLDGYVARITGRTTLLGQRLDMQWDSVGMLVAALLSVLYGLTPLLYLLVGLARYLYLFGLWLHKKQGRQTADLPPSRFRRAMAGMQMGFLAVVLMPVYSPPATQIAAVLFMLPLLAGFIRDFLYVTGWAQPRVPSHPAPAGDFWRQVGRLVTVGLPLALRAALIVLLASLILSQVQNNVPLIGILLVASAAIPALLLGVTGRLAALAVLLMAGFGLRIDIQDCRYWVVFLCSVLLFMIGTGKYSLWTPEDWLIDHRAGEVHS